MKKPSIIAQSAGHGELCWGEGGVVGFIAVTLRHIPHTPAEMGISAG
ncbi:hypothetical protein [Corynebacterium riegelii]|nr:hypothetical protein [Corynebacterium riegelii]